MHLWAKYLKEREGLEVLEKEHGFATYKFRGLDCYIQSIYVLPEQRRSKLASELADEISKIAKEKGIRILTGSIDGRAKGSDISEKVLRGYGMKPYTREGSVVYYFKEIT